ncbi:uncharacterized protein [Nicotiana tomentosiformis]|uniref:uncharacterized protein n=1 Tax=Nicotiana tomentosiformis TaxID=4098 RepID=UPI00388C91EA
MEKVKIIKEWLKTAQSHQKSYSDLRRRDLEFKEDDWVFLKVSPMNGVMQFGKKGKLSLRLELPPEMSLVHPVFHVSMLKQVVGDPSLISPIETIEVNEELTYEQIPVSILDRWLGPVTGETLASILEIYEVSQNLELLVYEVTNEPHWMLMKDSDPHSRMNDLK